MDLTEAFPDNPLIPSIIYAACTQSPITIPWGNYGIAIGSGFESTQSQSEKALRTSPLTIDGDHRTPFLYVEGSDGNFAESSTNSANSACEHVQFSVAASVGGSLLGASGQGTYESNAQTNTDVRDQTVATSAAANNGFKSSINSLTSKFLCGSIIFFKSPVLSHEAKSLLREVGISFSKPEHPFRHKYGDYYIGALHLGGSNATMISAASLSADVTEHRTAHVTVETLLGDTEDDINDQETASFSASRLQLNAFDSLDKWSCQTTSSGSKSWAVIKHEVDLNYYRGNSVEKRALEHLREHKLRHGSIVSAEACWSLSEAGMIAEVLLLPYTGMRDFVENVRY